MEDNYSLEKLLYFYGFYMLEISFYSPACGTVYETNKKNGWSGDCARSLIRSSETLVKTSCDQTHSDG